MSIEDRLQQIYDLQPLQDKVWVLRNECPKRYKKNLKLIYTKELQNLMNVEIDLIQTEIKLPDPANVPPVPEKPFGRNLDAMLEDQTRTIEALELLGML